MRPTMRRNLACSAALVIFLVLSTGTTTINSAHYRARIGDSELTIPAVELYAKYREDKDAAGLVYGYRTVTITGTVLRVKLNSFAPSIVVGAERARNGVRCIFVDAGREEIEHLSRGDEVTVKGMVYGRERNVVMRHCRLLESDAEQ